MSMPTRPHVTEYDVAVAADGTAASSLGGLPISAEEEWLAEHLLLAGLVRCTLSSLAYHVRQRGLQANASGNAHGIVTKREEDGLYAFVEIDASLTVDLEPPLEAGAVRELVAKAERGCFVGNSLTAKPRYNWTVNGEAIA